MIVKRKRLYVRMMAAALAVVMCFGGWCQDFEIALAEEIGDVSGNEMMEAVDEGESVSGSDIVINEVLENYQQNNSSAIVYSASAPEGIKGNGTGGIWIDINGAPYTTFQGYSYGQYAYTKEGCAWFASARVNELTGKGNTIWSGTKWWNDGKGQLGFITGQTIQAKALACYTGHIAVVEKIEGNIVYTSEGGYNGGGSTERNGYTIIRATTVNEVKRNGFLGFVYLGNTSAPDDTGSFRFSTNGPTGTRGFVTENNACLESKVYTNISSGIKCGIRIGTAANNWNIVNTHWENLSSAAYTQIRNNGYTDIWFNVQTELGKTLSKGTKYYYQFVVSYNNKEYPDEVRSFTTLGNNDTEKPKITNARITDVTKDGYTVVCNVSDNVGVVKVSFPTRKTEESDWKWLTGTINGNSASCRINVSNFGGTQTTYITNIYAYDAAGNASEGVGVQQFIDRTSPTVTDMKISDLTRDGYTVTCTVKDNTSVSKVILYAKKSTDSSWKQISGTYSGNTAVFKVKASDFGNADGIYLTKVYAEDTMGNSVTTGETSTRIDRTPPSITNVQITNITKDGYTVTCTISDNVGVTKVDFPTRLEGDSEDKRVWLAGTINGNQASRWVAAESFNNAHGVYVTQIYAYDEAGNGKIYNADIRQLIDRKPPVISDIRFSEADDTGFTISCSITDDSEMAAVYFPSWTADNGQDDLPEDWQSLPRYKGTKEGDRYVCRVENQDHDFETGLYCFNIYATDTFGNEAEASAEFDYRPACTSKAETQDQGHVYQLYEYVLTWEEARKKCEEMGGHLVTIGSAEEQAAVERLLSEAGRQGYFMGGCGTGKQPAWITGEAFGYTHWGPGWGDNAFQEQYVFELAKNGYWQLCGQNDKGRGFICEFETIQIEKVEFAEQKILMQKGETRELQLQVTPDTIKPFDVIWTSSDESVASVEDGIVTAYAGGSAVITAEFQGKRAECQIEVLVRAESISLNKTSLEMLNGDKERLQVIYDPADANINTEVIWSTDNPAVATVTQGGTVAALSPGTAQIKAVMQSDNTITAVCSLHVSGCTVTFDSRGGSPIDNLECAKGDRLIGLPVPERDGYVFDGWYKDEECHTLWNSDQDTVTGEMTLYAGWTEAHEGFWVKDIPDQIYTGFAIKPAVRVYSGNRLLTMGRDYTVSYKNNKKVNDTQNTNKAPAVIIKGKGNYKGKETVNFNIVKKNINDEDIFIDALTASYNGRTQQPLPVVKREGKKLANKKDFQVIFSDLSDGAYQEPGTYEIKIRGINNYTGVRSITLTITKQILLSKVSVSKIPDQNYDGTEKQPVPVLKYKGTFLSEEDYELDWVNNVSAGTASVIITGKGNFSGTKKVSFKIKGVSIKNVKVQGLEDQVYSGKTVYPSSRLTADGGNTFLREDEDYKVTCSRKKDAGTVVMTFTGINGYTGSIKKTFKIRPYNISDNEEGLFAISRSVLQVPYAKGGARPKPEVWFDGVRLQEGKDYSLSYVNNQKTTGALSDKAPTVIVTGKGNFKGTASRNFDIVPKNLGEVKVTVRDVVYNPKKNNFKSTPVLTDTDGKKLTAGKDYKKTFTYYHADGTPASPEDSFYAGMVIRVRIEAAENSGYTGAVTAEYKIARKSISSAKITFKQKSFEYTGSAVEPQPDDIIVKVNGQVLTGGKEGDKNADYIITGYEKNTDKGKARITIKGVNNYAGTKSGRFTIGAKGIRWFWRLFYGEG